MRKDISKVYRSANVLKLKLAVYLVESLGKVKTFELKESCLPRSNKRTGNTWRRPGFWTPRCAFVEPEFSTGNSSEDASPSAGTAGTKSTSGASGCARTTSGSVLATLATCSTILQNKNQH